MFGGPPMGVRAQAPNDTVTLHGLAFPSTMGGAERVNVREGATYLCVGGWKRKFIKFWMTGDELPEASARPFLQALVDMLGPADEAEPLGRNLLFV
jgi:hypothetical protein